MCSREKSHKFQYAAGARVRDDVLRGDGGGGNAKETAQKVGELWWIWEKNSLQFLSVVYT